MFTDKTFSFIHKHPGFYSLCRVRLELLTALLINGAKKLSASPCFGKTRKNDKGHKTSRCKRQRDKANSCGLVGVEGLIAYKADIEVVTR